MKSAVWKYVLTPGITAIEIPRNGKVLCAREQDGDVCIWVHVYPDEVRVIREFASYGTGVTFNDFELQYLGSVHLKQGSEVFHVFERVKRVVLPGSPPQRL